MHLEIRSLIEEDLVQLKKVLDSIDLFPSDMLKEMSSDFLNNPDSEDLWFSALQNGQPIAFGYCAPEKLTEGTFNLYALGIIASHHKKGIGSQIISHIESTLTKRGHRLLIIDTSGTANYENARLFYEKLGYTKEATIRNFWAEGDDKITYIKDLRAPLNPTN